MSTTRYHVLAVIDKCAHFRSKELPSGNFEMSYFVDLDDKVCHRAQVDKLLGKFTVAPGPAHSKYAKRANAQLVKWIEEAKLLGPLMNNVAFLGEHYAFSLKVWSDVHPLPELRRVES